MRIVVPFPDADYYLWQVLVQWQHFREMGYDRHVAFLCYFQGQPSVRLSRLMRDLPIWTWKDPRVTAAGPSYNPAMKPWLVGAWLDEVSDPGQPFAYLDPDAIFTRSIDHWPTGWHASDTDSYTGPGYLRSKGEGLWLDLCRIAGVTDPEEASTYRGGGAQYVIDRTDGEFWREVSARSIEGYHHMLATRSRYWPEGHQYPVQEWCSEMYFTWLAAIRHGLAPVADPAMSFLWANNPLDQWGDHMFFHDAGVTSSASGDFCKLDYQTSPFRRTLVVKPDTAAARYVDLIHRTEQELPHLTWRE